MISRFYSTNSADPDKMPHIAAFYLGLHCLSDLIIIAKPKYIHLI